MARTIVITHRRGNAAASEVGASFTGYFAAVPNGKADIAFVVANGVVQQPVAPANRDLDRFEYALGAFSLGNGGFGWAGAALIAAPYIGRAGLDTFATYTLGTVTGADLSAGSGWADTALILAH
jgi:hypothetical protein